MIPNYTRGINNRVKSQKEHLANLISRFYFLYFDEVKSTQWRCTRIDLIVSAKTRKIIGLQQSRG